MFNLLFVLLAVADIYVLCDTVDHTRVSGAYGVPVVDAVVQLLQQTCLESNHMFLRRVATIGTHDGDDNAGQNNGGIWKIDLEKFNETATCLPQEQISIIYSYFKIDWTKVTWADMEKPLYSGLAASLYIHCVQREPILESIDEQGYFYNKYYNNATSEIDFYVAASKLKFYNCSDQSRDIAFVVDTSSTITEDNLLFIRTFIADVTRGLPKNADETKLSLVQYSSKPFSIVNFTNFTNLIDFQREVNKLKKSAGETNTDEALKFTADEIFTVGNGMRLYSAKVVVLITSNTSTDKPAAILQAARLKARGIRVLVIGSGHSVDRIEMREIASTPGCSNAIYVSGHSKLRFINEELTGLICQGPELLHVGTNTLPCDRISNILLPGNPQGQTVEVIVKSGELAVYGSYVLSRPNEAFHEVFGKASPLDPLTLYIQNNSDLVLRMDDRQMCTGNVTIIITIGQSDRSCNNQKADVVFLIESSTSVKDDEFQSMLTFVGHFVNDFDIGPANMLVSVITYADTSSNQFWLNEHTTRQELISAVSRVHRQHGQTNTGVALRFARDNSFLTNHGGRTDSLQVVVLLTKSTSINRTETLSAGRELQKEGIRVLTVGIGPNIDLNEINHIVTDYKHMFSVNGFSELETVKSEVTKISCGVVKILCVEAGIVRNCTSKEMEHSIPLRPDISLPNICVTNLKMAPHPTDITKFLLCDINKQMLTVQCPVSQIFCVQSMLCQTSCSLGTHPTTSTASVGLATTTKVTSDLQTTTPVSCLQNPCKQGGDYYPACKENEYIHCGNAGIGMLLTCYPGKVWNQVIQNCVNKYLLESDQPVKDVPNPCHDVTGDVYFAWQQDSHKFIHCDGYGDGFIISCQSSSVWDQQTRSCIPINPVVG